MSQRIARREGMSRRKVTLLWSLLGAAVIITLLYLEQTALIYVISTIGVTVLLIVVARADLKGGQMETPITTANDSAALGSGITINAPTAPTTTFGARPRKKKRRS